MSTTIENSAPTPARKTQKKKSAAAAAPECPVCVEKFNVSTRKEVKCCYCEFSSCRSCTKNYILDKTDYASCMNCKKEWERKFLVENFEKNFITKTYKEHREQVLFDREKSFMAATMPIVERKKILQVDNRKISELHRLIGTLQEQAYRMEIMYRRNSDFNNVYEDPEDFAVNGCARTGPGAATPATGSEESRHFVRKCTFPECRGFLSKQWKCGLCENWSCPQCFEIKGRDNNAPHECKPENLETAKLIRSDTRPCPKCGEGIFKIEGCDQMFCTLCQTPFSWRTGIIVTSGNIHNPHYYEMQRRLGNNERTLGDFECGREVNTRFIINCRNLFGTLKCSYVSGLFIERARNLIELVDIHLPRYRTDLIHENQDLRVKYLMNEISENMLKVTLQRREKVMHYNREMYNILNTYVMCFIDIAYKIYNEMRGKVDEINAANNNNPYNTQKIFEIDRIRGEAIKNIYIHMNELNELLKYTNDYLYEISTTFMNVGCALTEKFSFIRTKNHTDHREKTCEKIEHKLWLPPIESPEEYRICHVETMAAAQAFTECNRGGGGVGSATAGATAPAPAPAPAEETVFPDYDSAYESSYDSDPDTQL